MNWSEIIDSVKQKSGDIAFDYSDYCYISMSNIVREMQDRTFSISGSSIRTQYGRTVEVTTLSCLIIKKITDIKTEDISQKKLSELFDMVLCIGMLYNIGRVPFGYHGENAVREWFVNNLPSIKFKGESVAEILGAEVAECLYHFSTRKRLFRYAALYSSDERIKNMSKIILDEYSLTEQCLYYRKFFKSVDNEKLKKNPLKFIIDAADFIVLITSSFEGAVRDKNINCFQLLSILRSDEYYPDDITADEYNIFAETVHDFTDIYSENSVQGCEVDENIIIGRWADILRKKMTEAVSECFILHYDEIMNGQYKTDLINDSWCRILNGFFKGAEKEYLFSAEKYFESALLARNRISAIMDNFIKAVISYDTDTEQSAAERRIIFRIPDIYRNLYHDIASGRTENEKLFLRIIMVMDFICGMNDEQVKKLSAIIGNT